MSRIWLLDSYPSTRWQVMRDLTDQPEEGVIAERTRVAPKGGGPGCRRCCSPSPPGGITTYSAGSTAWAGPGVAPDTRTDEAIGLVADNRNDDCRWLRQNIHPGDAHFELDRPEGEPSRWNTLRALRVLRWAGGDID